MKLGKSLKSQLSKSELRLNTDLDTQNETQIDHVLLGPIEDRCDRAYFDSLSQIVLQIDIQIYEVFKEGNEDWMQSVQRYLDKTLGEIKYV